MGGVKKSKGKAKKKTPKKPASDEAYKFSVAQTPYYDDIHSHLEKWYGPVKTVLHEIVSDVVHMDVMVIQPSKDRPFYTLVTCGMSALPMTVPSEDKAEQSFKFAELIITLPASSRYLAKFLSHEDEGDGEDEEKDYYPIGYLKQFARYPHLADTWIGPGHTLVTADPPVPLAPDTSMTAFIAHFPFAISSEGWRLKTSDGSVINFLELYPIHTAELEYKLKSGGDALINRLEEAGALTCFNPARPSVIQRKRFLGLF